MRNYKYAVATVMAVTMISLVGCVAPGTPGYPATSVDDANVSAQIRTALVNEAMFKVNQIRIETVTGVVTLSGTVSISSFQHALIIQRKSWREAYVDHKAL